MTKRTPTKLKPTEIVTPLAMMPLEELPDDVLGQRVSRIGQSCIQGIEQDSQYLAKLLAELEEKQIWQKLAPTWDEFCEKVLGRPAWYVNMIRDSIARIDKNTEGDK